MIVSPATALAMALLTERHGSSLAPHGGLKLSSPLLPTYHVVAAWTGSAAIADSSADAHNTPNGRYTLVCFIADLLGTSRVRNTPTNCLGPPSDICQEKRVSRWRSTGRSGEKFPHGAAAA